MIICDIISSDKCLPNVSKEGHVAIWRVKEFRIWRQHVFVNFWKIFTSLDDVISRKNLISITTLTMEKLFVKAIGLMLVTSDQFYGAESWNVNNNSSAGQETAKLSGVQKFLTVLTTAWLLSLPWVRWIQFTPPLLDSLLVSDANE